MYDCCVGWLSEPSTRPSTCANLLFSLMGKLSGSSLARFLVWYRSSSTAVSFALSALAASATRLSSRRAYSSSCLRTSRMRITPSFVFDSLSRICSARVTCLVYSSGVVARRGSFFTSKVWFCTLPSTVSRTVYVPGGTRGPVRLPAHRRSEEHTSELQSLRHLVCRLLAEKK